MYLVFLFTLISMYLVFLFLSLTILRRDRRFATLNFHSNVYGLADDQPSFLDPPNHGNKSLWNAVFLESDV